MGILHSITRFLCCITKEEEEGGYRSQIHPFPLHRRQSHYNHYGRDSSERLHKMWIFGSSIWNTVKVLLHKLRFFLSLIPRSRKVTADPVLPIQNPESSIICTEPLLIHTTLISGSDTFASVASDLSTNDQELLCENVDSLSHPKWRPEENNSTKMNLQSDDVIVSIPDFAYSFAHSSVSDEILCSAILIQENPPRNVVPFPDEKIIEDKSEEEEEEEHVKIKSIFAVGGERWIKHYSSRQRILLVGEGDFSFAACLAVAFGCASNMIATSLDPEAFLKTNYRRASSNIEKLRSRESKVMHGVDATKLMNHALIGHLKFDRVIFNFPYAGLKSLKNLPRESQLRLHRRLVSLFLKNAREMISENGEIHISHKINGFHVEFKLESIASSHRLRLIEAVNFNCLDYPGYNTKYGFGGDNNFNCNPSNTYKFGLKWIQR